MSKAALEILINKLGKTRLDANDIDSMEWALEEKHGRREPILVHVFNFSEERALLLEGETESQEEVFSVLVVQQGDRTIYAGRGSQKYRRDIGLIIKTMTEDGRYQESLDSEHSKDIK